MKRIGIIIGSERVPISDNYYRKYSKIFDKILDELNIDEITYDIAIYALAKHYSPKEVEIIPLWKLEYSKKDIMDKMNSFFGYTVVAKLKFISFDDEQKIFIKKEAKQENVAINKYQNKINDVKNDKIKKSLIELTKVFKKK